MRRLIPFVPNCECAAFTFLPPISLGDHVRKTTSSNTRSISSPLVAFVTSRNQRVNIDQLTRGIILHGVSKLLCYYIGKPATHQRFVFARVSASPSRPAAMHETLWTDTHTTATQVSYYDLRSQLEMRIIVEPADHKSIATIAARHGRSCRRCTRTPYIISTPCQVRPT